MRQEAGTSNTVDGGAMGSKVMKRVSSFPSRPSRISITGREGLAAATSRVIVSSRSYNKEKIIKFVPKRKIWMEHINYLILFPK